MTGANVAGFHDRPRAGIDVHLGAVHGSQAIVAGLVGLVVVPHHGDDGGCFMWWKKTVTDYHCGGFSKVKSYGLNLWPLI